MTAKYEVVVVQTRRKIYTGIEAENQEEAREKWLKGEGYLRTVTHHPDKNDSLNLEITKLP